MLIKQQANQPEIKQSNKKLSLTTISIVLAVVIIVGGVIAYANREYLIKLISKESPVSQTKVAENKYVEFLAEIYDKIKENYWEKISDDDLVNFYKLGSEKLKEQIPEINLPAAVSSDKNGLIALTTEIINKLPEEKKKDYTVNLAAVVLANLEPFGRSALYTTKKQEELTNRVFNIDPNTNLYETIGVNPQASATEINQTVEQQTAELQNIINDQTQTAEAKEQAEQKLALVERAKETLTNEEDRQQYDESKAESTVIAELIRPDILHLKIKQLSPQTFDEFQKKADQIDQENNPELNSLILDLRDNIGGSMDLLPYFLGPFIGLNQYAYDWYQQGNYTPFKTATDWLPSLVRYKKVVILANENTQSSAEVMVATLKKYNVGLVVGKPTKGWGTIEKVFELDNQLDDNETYSMFLVHHITLRDDNQPIEGRGVDPLISIEAADWQEQLLSYFNYRTLVNAVEEIWFEE